jgi:pimeloyl-ACP methyl ester carboxylesterase
MPYFEIEDISLYYEEIGVGEPIIFLHNAFSRGIIAFSAQIVPLQARYRCIFPDLRGHGRTRSKDLDWTIPQLADDIMKLIDNLNIDKVNLVGFSMGGGVALYIATKYPKRIKSLVTIGTASCVTDGIKSNADNCEYHILKNEEDKNYIELLKHNHYEAHMGDWKSFVKTSINNWRKYPNLTIEELRKIQAPSMFISGEKDNSIKMDHLLRLCEGVIDSRIRVIEDCGHGPHLIGEKPELLNEVLLQFLDENREENIL